MRWPAEEVWFEFRRIELLYRTAWLWPCRWYLKWRHPEIIHLIKLGLSTQYRHNRHDLKAWVFTPWADNDAHYAILDFIPETGWWVWNRELSSSWLLYNDSHLYDMSLERLRGIAVQVGKLAMLMDAMG